jgi:hypothetical protein
LLPPMAPNFPVVRYSSQPVTGLAWRREKRR